MFCLYCGAQLPEEALFCNRCGRKLQLPSHHTSAALAPLPLSVVSMPASVDSEQQDGRAASPSVSEQPRVDPTQDGAPSSSPSESSLPTIYRTEELSLLPLTPGTASRGILTLPEQQPPQAPGHKKRRRIWMVLSSIVVVLLLLAAWSGFMYANRSTPSKRRICSRSI